MSKQNNIPLLEKFSIRDVSLFLGRGQSPTYTENHTKFKAINQKCVRNGKVNPAESRHHDPIIAIRETAILQNTDICINSTGNGTIGRSGIWVDNNDAIYFADSHITILRADKSKVNPKYILELLQSHDVNNKIEIYCYSGSTNQVELNSSAFASLAIQILPLDQQQSIADILTTLDNLIDHTESLIAKYQSIKQGMMHDLFTRGVDANGRLRPPRDEAPELYKESALGWIPREWEVVPVEQIGSVRLGRQRSPKHTSGKFTTPYLRVANVFDGWIDYSDVLEMDFTPEEKQIYDLQPGDILLNEGQSLELVGRSALYDGLSGRYCFQNTLVRFRTFPENNNIFCRFVFKYWLDTERFYGIAKQTTSVAHLGADRFAKMSFQRPSHKEQLKISSLLNSLENKILNIVDHKDKYLYIKTGLMNDLLTGKVRVKHGQKHSRK